MYFVDIKENKFVYVWNINKHIILIFWPANKQSRGERKGVLSDKIKN